MLISIDREKCKKDGLCVRECPAGLLCTGADNYPDSIEKAEDICFKCGHCIAVCPHGALTLGTIRPDSLLPAQKPPAFEPEALLAMMKSRRSIRHYKEQNVSRELIEKLLDTASYAPTAKNQQAFSWTVIEKRESVLELAKMVIDGFRKAETMQFMVSSFDAGNDLVFRGAPHLVIAHAPADSILPIVDCTIGLTYLELAAWELGLGTCWAGFLMMSAASNPAIEKHLGIPDGHRLYGALMLGYPHHYYQRVPFRKKREITWR